MENMTVHLPEFYLKLIDIILNTKDYPCRSEFIRIAVRKLLKKDQILLLNPEIKEYSHPNQKGEELQDLSIQKPFDQYSFLQINRIIQKNSKNMRKGAEKSNDTKNIAQNEE